MSRLLSFRRLLDRPHLVPELLCKVQGRAGVVEPGALEAEVGAEAEAELDGVDVVAPDGEVEARHPVLVVVQRVAVEVAAGLHQQPQGVVPPDGGRLCVDPKLMLHLQATKSL